MRILRQLTILKPAFSSLFILLVFLIAGCTKSSELTLVGTYTRNVIIDEQAWEVNLMLTDDGYLRWIPVDSIPGHTASEVRYRNEGNDQIAIYDDADCGSEAVYWHVVDGVNLNLLPLQESCLPREGAISGDWKKVNQ
ncbi:MAG: hypothetical protein K9G61_09060 [Bacteroidales bacterium]|nr:hypothetical protein [Bacteroidales bacterium]